VFKVAIIHAPLPTHTLSPANMELSHIVSTNVHHSCRPPTTLPEKIRQTWLYATLYHILTYIAALETHLYNMSHALQPP